MVFNSGFKGLNPPSTPHRVPENTQLIRKRQFCKGRNFYDRIMASNFCGIMSILFECTGHKLVSDWFPTMTISSPPPVVTDWQSTDQ